MNKFSNVENERPTTSSELTESHFNDEWYNKSMHEIGNKRVDQREADWKKAWKLTEILLKDEKMPINDFIESERQKGNDNIDIATNLIKAWYEENDIMNSSLAKWWKEIKKEFINNIFRLQSFRFNREEEFDEKFFDVVRESLSKWIDIDDVISSIPLKRTITMEDINYLREKNKNNSDYIPSIKFSGKILPDLDWSQSKEIFDYLSFDDKTFSQTSKEHLPEWYNPSEVFQKGKTIGLWIDDVHRAWYTWKWVSVAICDWQLKPHNDVQTKGYVVEDHASGIPDYYHASAVSSILVWKQTGIAPESDLYFFAEKQNSSERDWWDDLKLALDGILEQNKKLPDDKKIRVVSISGPLYWKGIEDIVKKLENSWVWVLDSGEFWKSFWYLEKKDPMWDPNDFSNYQHCLWRHKSHLRKLDALFVNSGDRTVADPRNPTAYRHDTHACASWAIPVVAWYYALACQADPTMTPKRFKKLARETSFQTDSTIRSKKNGKVKRSEKATKIKVIDIEALVQKIEEEKNKQYYT